METEIQCHEQEILKDDEVRFLLDGAEFCGTVISKCQSYTNKYRVFTPKLKTVVAIEQKNILGRVLYK